ncbi:hypothetical protein [Shewanella sp.]|uniref:hypothetical protein n=1 Tax=Shewanella sp. TaxID=50422 RepID=UPI0035688B59
MLDILSLFAGFVSPIVYDADERPEQDSTLAYVFAVALIFFTGFALLFAYLASIYH